MTCERCLLINFFFFILLIWGFVASFFVPETDGDTCLDVDILCMLIEFIFKLFFHVIWNCRSLFLLRMYIYYYIKIARPQIANTDAHNVYICVNLKINSQTYFFSVVQ